MSNRYVLWRCENGWILTHTNTLWDNEVKSYRIFRTLHEFANWAIGFEQPRPVEPKPKTLSNGKVTRRKKVTHV
jgi:hypothetical protein